MTYPKGDPKYGQYWRDDWVDGNELYANVGADGIVVFEKGPDPTLSRLPVLIGPADKVKRIIRQWAKLHQDNETYYFSNVATASNQIEGAMLLGGWLVFLQKRLAELDQ